MRLGALVTEIERARGPITGVELADRLGISTVEAAAMLDALRAAGRIGPEAGAPTAVVDTCSSAGSCSMNCPGPDKCALTVAVNVTGLQIRPVR